MTIPASYAQVTHEFTGTQIPNGAAVVYGVDNLADQSAAEIAALALASFTFLMPQLSAGIVLVNTRVKLGPDETGPVFELGSATAGGVASGSGLAPNSAYLLTKTTSVGGRRGKGRMFVPGVSETVIDPDGSLTGAFRATLQGLADDMFDNLASGGADMVLLHGPATEWVLVDGQPRRVPVAGAIPAPYTVTSLQVAAKVGTQRRRLR